MIETKLVKEKFLSNLKDYCHFAKKDDFINVTEWVNGEGVTIEINSSEMGNRLFQLTHGEFDAITTLINYRCE